MSFPTSLFEPREIENKPGAVYNPDKKRVLFAEDINAITSEIIEIEKRLIPSENVPLPYDIKIGNPDSGFLFSAIEITDPEDVLFGSFIPLLQGLVKLSINIDPESEPTVFDNLSLGLAIKRGIYILSDPANPIYSNPELNLSDNLFPNSEYTASLRLRLSEEYGSTIGMLEFDNIYGFIFNNSLYLYPSSGSTPHIIFDSSVSLAGAPTGSLWRDGNTLKYRTSDSSKSLAFVEDIEALYLDVQEFAFSVADHNSRISATVMDNISSEFGMYRVNYYLRTHTTDAGAGTVRLVVNADDGISPNSQATPFVELTSLDAAVGSFIVVKGIDADITYEIDGSGSMGSATYSLIIKVQKLG